MRDNDNHVLQKSRPQFKILSHIVTRYRGRMTKLYVRTTYQITLDEIERIAI